MAYNHKSLDVVAAVQGTDTIYLTVLVFREGRLRDKKDFTFDCFESIESVVGEFVLSYYMGRQDGPSELFLDRAIPDQDLLAQLLTEDRGKKLQITVPTRGQPLRLEQRRPGPGNPHPPHRPGDDSGGGAGGAAGAGKAPGLH